MDRQSVKILNDLKEHRDKNNDIANLSQSQLHAKIKENQMILSLLNVIEYDFMCNQNEIFQTQESKQKHFDLVLELMTEINFEQEKIKYHQMYEKLRKKYRGLMQENVKKV